jgi:magnesium chelatase subunit I
MTSKKPVFPFTAIVGQEAMKLALLLNVVSPSVGGVLIRGEKGTAKSTAVRGLASLLPDIPVVAGCRFSCSPDEPAKLCPECLERLAKGPELPRATAPARVVELPVGATEDRVVGALDLEQAIREGQRRFEPGVLARANRAILYVDEVNLLDDHIVDALLDAAAMGVNTVEREGVSFSHPARFALVGTMNPEEGELRPQLLDRFGLCVEVGGIPEPAARMEVVRRLESFETDPDAFLRRYAESEREIAERLAQARERVGLVRVSDASLLDIATLAIALGVDGHRADLVMMRASKALAALEGRDEVTRADVKRAAMLALPHRMRRRPFEQVGLDQDAIESILETREAA